MRAISLFGVVLTAVVFGVGLEVMHLVATIRLRNAKRLVKTHEHKHHHLTTMKQEFSNPCEGNLAPLAFLFPYGCALTKPLVVAYFGGDADLSHFVERAPQAVGVFLEARGEIPLSPIPDNIDALGGSLLWLASSQFFEGTIPSSLAGLTILNNLYLAEHNIDGTIPTFFGDMTALTSLFLPRNKLTGTIPIELKKLTLLREFNFAGNPLTGTLPNLFATLTNLNAIHLDSLSGVSGSLPSQLGTVSALRILDLSNSGYTGTLPMQLSNLSLLEKLFISNTKVTGAIPPLTFPNLSDLNLSYNSLTGTLPTSVASLTKVHQFDVSQCGLSGTLPSELGLLTAAKLIDLSNNKFTGTIPIELVGVVQYATTINIANNKLHGQLPDSWVALATGESKQVNCIGSGLTDSICRTKRTDFVSWELFSTLTVISVLFLAAVVGLGVMMVKYKQHPQLKSSGVLFSLMTLCGLGLLLCAVPLFGLAMVDARLWVRTSACRGAMSLVSFSSIITTSCISVRNYPVWRIFNNPRMTVMALAPPYLMRAVVLAVVVNAALVAPLIIRVKASDFSDWCELEGSLVVPLLNVCYLTLHIILAAVMSYLIRTAPSRYNENTLVGMATYNVATFGAAGVAISFVTTTNAARFLAISLSIFVCVVSFTGYAHVTKLWTVVVGDPKGEKSQPRSNVKIFIPRLS